MTNLPSPIVENASQRKGKVSNEETRLHRDFGWLRRLMVEAGCRILQKTYACLNKGWIVGFVRVLFFCACTDVYSSKSFRPPSVNELLMTGCPQPIPHPIR